MILVPGTVLDNDLKCSGLDSASAGVEPRDCSAPDVVRGMTDSLMVFSSWYLVSPDQSQADLDVVLITPGSGSGQCKSCLRQEAQRMWSVALCETNGTDTKCLSYCQCQSKAFLASVH